MALRVEQMYVNSDDTESVINAIRTCCLERGKRFSPHPRYPLNGVEQTLRILIKDKRRFLVAEAVFGWTCIWEKADIAEFADPGLASCLSVKLATRALWLQLNEDYNIWAFQIYNDGTLEEEMFRPENYFLAKADVGDYESYGSCHALASELGGRIQLPYFLMTAPAVGQGKKLVPSLRKVVVRI